MALEKELTDPYSTDMITSYCRITSISFNLAGGAASVQVSCWRSAEAAQNGRQPFRNFMFMIGAGRQANGKDPGMPSFIELMEGNQDLYNAMKTALYNLVKTQPELADSKDV